jgi:hypothetical protein
MILFDVLLGASGILIWIWTVTLRRLSVAQRPRFTRQLWFRLGVPLLGGFLAAAGFALAFSHSVWWTGLSMVAIALLAVLLLKHNPYSTMIRILYDGHISLKKENPQASEFDLLYSLVKSRWPKWSEDRIMEMCVGKDIKQLVLLLLVVEFEVHPLQDMELYQCMKRRVEVLYPAR